MPESFDPRCWFSGSLDAEGAAQVLKAIDIENRLGTGCKVSKHPQCCVICAANEDCSRLPLHVHCRCRPMPTVDGMEVDPNASFA